MQVVKNDISHFEAWLKVGIILCNINEPKKAIRCFNAAINLRNSSSVAWYNMGNAQKSCGNHDKAEWCYKRASDLIDKTV